MILTAFGLAIFIGFIFYELTGLAAGGIIVPGYVALYMNEPLRIVLTLFLAWVVYLLVKALAQFTVIFGRRRFLLMILIGYALRFLFDQFRAGFIESSLELQIIGYIIPGLIANEFYRQGVWKTVLALGIVSVITYLVLLLITLP